MALRTPLILISGSFSQLPSGDVVPGSDPIALASGNAALVVANNALSSGVAALASGNAALSLAATALASGNAALANATSPSVTDTLLLL
jgi:hypothetical protein